VGGRRQVATHVESIRLPLVQTMKAALWSAQRRRAARV